MTAPSIPPVLDPRRAKALAVQLQVPVYIELAATTILPALEWLNRQHIARWQEAEMGASDGL